MLLMILLNVVAKPCFCEMRYPVFRNPDPPSEMFQICPTEEWQRSLGSTACAPPKIACGPAELSRRPDVIP